MNLKALLPILAVAASGNVFASDYNFELNLDYKRYEWDADAFFDDSSTDFEMVTASGAYYFGGVDLVGPWAESAFMSRSSNVGMNFTDYQGGSEGLGIFGTFYGGPIVLGGRFEQTSYDDFDGDSLNDYHKSIEFGYMVMKNWKVSGHYNWYQDGQASEFGEDKVDGGWLISSKGVIKTAENQWLNIEGELSTDDFYAGDYYAKVGATYYFNQRFGVGFTSTIIDNEAGFDDEDEAASEFEMHASYFFTKNIGLKASYSNTNDEHFYDNTFGLTVTGRF